MRQDDRPPDPNRPIAGPRREEVLSMWESVRRPAHPRDLQLSPFALKWMASLPRDARPTALACRYPRIVNALCLIWSEPAATHRYFDRLLLDERGTRRGFPRPIVEELSRLRLHYGTLHPEAPAPADDFARR